MSKELVIASNLHETKVAVLEEDQLVEVYFQRANEYSLAGSIHKGRVTRVLPGMQSAFVDLGLERDTFLYVSDFFEENEDFDPVTESEAKGGARPERFERGDRRDRGPRGDRGPERQGDRLESRPIPIKVDAAAEVIEPPSLPVESLSEGEPTPDAAGEASLQSAPTPEAPATGSDTRPFADRGDRGGDRRRRSRRRRMRGRGFPENKYAQPGPEPAPSVAPVRQTVIEAAAPPDMLILPGESLAKYRMGRSEGVAAHPAHAESTSAEEEYEQDAAAVEALVDELESSEEEHLTLTHGDRPQIHPEHEALEASVVPAERLEALRLVTAEAGPEAAADREQDGDNGEREAELASKLADELRVDKIEPDLADDEELEGVAIEDEDSEAEPLVEESDAVEASGAVEAPSTGEAPDAESDAASPLTPSGAEAPQVAYVREQGGRSMHRVSRRMRRRRGGNRGLPPVGVVESAGGSASSAAATAAAPAPAARVEPDPGAESRPERSEQREERSAKSDDRQARGEDRERSARGERALPSITELLKPGQEIIVQIAKEPLGQKGARITSHIALPGRYVVFMPSVEHLGVSRKIASDEERLRLKRILQAHRTGTAGGFIVRTAGEGRTEEEIAADMGFLYNLWLDIRQKAEKRPAPLLLHHDLDVVQRILRDQLTDEFKAIWADSEEMYESVLRFVQRFQPALVGRVKMYTRSVPIFDAFGITQELEKALRPKVWLKSGGYIVINQTEALVAIDVNTGKYVGKSNRLEDTIVKTNTEAVKEIVRQVRLRDLGGIIVVDFIDMDERKNRQKVMQALEEAMRADKAPYKILQFNDFGLVAITRKRVKQSLERTLCAPCPYCDGAGYVKSVQTIISEILAEAQKIARAVEGKDVVLRVHPDVAKVLKSNNNRYLEELEEILGRPVLVSGDAALHHEKFDLA
jgi:ribonuclease G